MKILEYGVTAGATKINSIIECRISEDVILVEINFDTKYPILVGGGNMSNTFLFDNRETEDDPNAPCTVVNFKTDVPVTTISDGWGKYCIRIVVLVMPDSSDEDNWEERMFFHHERG